MAFDQEIDGFTEVDSFFMDVTDMNPVLAVFESVEMISDLESLSLG